MDQDNITILGNIQSWTDKEREVALNALGRLLRAKEKSPRPNWEHCIGVDVHYDENIDNYKDFDTMLAFLISDAAHNNKIIVDMWCGKIELDEMSVFAIEARTES